MHLPRATTTNSGSRAAVTMLLASAALALSEQSALAEGDQDLTNGLYTFIGGTVAGTASLPFLVADLAYTAQGEWLPPGWAITQILIGGGVNVVVAGWGASVYSHGCGRPAEHCGGVLALTLTTTVLSAGFIAHGAVSLSLYEPEPTTTAPRATRPKSQSAHVQWMPDIVIMRDRSTLVVFTGVF